MCNWPQSNTTETVHECRLKAGLWTMLGMHTDRQKALQLYSVVRTILVSMSVLKAYGCGPADAVPSPGIIETVLRS